MVNDADPVEKQGLKPNWQGDKILLVQQSQLKQANRCGWNWVWKVS